VYEVDARTLDEADALVERWQLKASHATIHERTVVVTEVPLKPQRRS
jgi:hypothetical protein